MTDYWTAEKLSALEPKRLEVVRQNAQKAGRFDIVRTCEDIQSRWRTSVNSADRATGPVIGFHFVCDNDYEVTPATDGMFWSGVWAVSEAWCDGAIAMNGYVALHSSKRDKSYRQGFIVEWRREQRTKGQRQLGVSFLLRPFETRLSWHGGGAGEKGYRRAFE